LFSKNRHLRGLKSGSGNSEGEYPKSASPSHDATSLLSDVANDRDSAEPADRPLKSWPFAYALGFALTFSLLAWAIIAAIIHYF
jgi:hypothetical protein